RPEKSSSRARWRASGGDARAAIAGVATAGRAAEDRHPTAYRRAQHRFRGHDQTTGGRTHTGVLVPRQAPRPPPAADVLDYAYERALSRHYPERTRPLAALHRCDRRRRPTLLSLDRG